MAARGESMTFAARTVTNPYPGAPADVRLPVRSRLETVMLPVVWLKQIICALRGHDYLVHSAPQRMFLRCTWCDHETPGWHVG